MTRKYSWLRDDAGRDMYVRQVEWNPAAGWSVGDPERLRAGLVLYFGGRDALDDGARHRELQALFPRAHLLGCSTGGQIVGGEVADETIAAVALGFDATPLALARTTVGDISASRAGGAALGRALAAYDLAGVFVLADGLGIDGGELVAGLTAEIGRAVPVTGGLAGDGPRFARTLVGADAAPQERTAGAVGFYGRAIRIGHGCAGGWDVFGPLRRVTRSAGNMLLELDGEPALDLYRRYLGDDEATALPAAALRFPLRIFDPDRPETAVVRTVFGVDHAARGLTISSHVPQGWVAQLMRGNFDRLAAGAGEAARDAATPAGADGVAVLVSCIGRRLLMGQRITDEIEAVEAEIDPRLARLGFYSYGEIAPHAVAGPCELHNQTMTITTLTEIAE